MCLSHVLIDGTRLHPQALGIIAPHPRSPLDKLHSEVQIHQAAHCTSTYDSDGEELLFSSASEDSLEESAVIMKGITVSFPTCLLHIKNLGVELG